MLISYSTIPVLCPECLLQGLHWPLSAGWSHFPYNWWILGHLGRVGQASVTSNFNLQLLGANLHFNNTCSNNLSTKYGQSTTQSSYK